jgi:hypothetical protein
MSFSGRSLVRADMALAQYRPLSVQQRPTRGTVTAPKGHNMSAQGKQPRAQREALRCVVGLHHARPRLRSPGVRMAGSAQSPERAQQMAGQTITGSQTRTICGGDQFRTTSERTIDRAPLRVASGNRRTGRWRLLRPFRAVGNILVSATQGGVAARKTRGHFPWADMLRPLRGEETPGSASRWAQATLRDANCENQGNRSRAGGEGHSDLAGFPSPNPAPQRCRLE